MEKFGDGISDHELNQLTALFQILSDKTRIRILLLLAEGERNVSTMCRSLGLPQPTISHHLSLLLIRNIVGNRRQGKQVFYNLNNSMELDGGVGLQLGLEKLAVHIVRKPETKP